MRSPRELVFWISASVALFLACEPNLEALSSEFGLGGINSSAGGASSGGKGGNGNAGHGGLPGTGGISAEGGESFGGVTGEGGSGGVPVLPDSCADGAKAEDESDIDCGGSSACVRCDTNGICTQASDCVSGVCTAGHCAAPSCTDKVLNQSETAMDCGGECAVVSPCEAGVHCKVNSDCASSFCSGSKVCTDHCVSKRRESDETDTDCGGSSCSPCADGKACIENSDCTNGMCKEGLCVGPNCSDGLKNQDETDKDCGGVCRATKTCNVGDGCLVAADCSSYVCTSAHCVADIVIPTNDVIDDMEDGNFSISANGGRSGYWYAYGDGTGTAVFEPVALSPKRGASTTSLHYSGSGYRTWGSGIGFDFNNPGGAESTKNPYDASAYTGVTFWAKATASTSVMFQLPDRNTQVRGGICTSCDHHWQTLVTIGTEWTRYTVRFADLQLEGGTVPTPTAFDKTGIIMMQMHFSTGKVFDVWVDDFALVK